MAKALLGYVGGDSRLLDENQRLRRRIADLQTVVLRLQAENDLLAAQPPSGRAADGSRHDLRQGHRLPVT